MSVYRVPLQNASTDVFQLPVSCGGHNFLLEFSWDMVSQKQYDDIKLSLAAISASNPLCLIPTPESIIPNTNFISYVSSWAMSLDAFELYAGKWVNEILYNLPLLDWELFQEETDEQVTLFTNKYISFNHISKLQEFLVYLQAMSTAAIAEDSSTSLSLLQTIPDPLFLYIGQYLSYSEDVLIQLEELEELLFWSITAHYGNESCTTALEIGAANFDQQQFPRIMFDSPKDKIGRSDLSSVIMWIGIQDGSL